MPNHEDSEKNLTMEGITLPHALLIVLAVLMMIIGIYLTKHYYAANFPVSLEQGTFCNISSYFNCDVSTFSPLSNIFNIPISLFGALLGFFLLLGSLFPTAVMEKTNKFLVLVNAAGAIVLAAYSFFALQGMCPMCMAYWVCSWLVAILFFKYGVHKFRPHIGVLLIYLIPTLFAGAGLHFYYQKLESRQSLVSKSIINQYFSLPNQGNPKVTTPSSLLISASNFEDAPLQLSIFSDFQCPACKRLSHYIEPIIRKYSGKMNIRYYYFPLDDHCNPGMKGPLHPMACQAAQLAYCVASEKFFPIHQQLFENQNNLSVKYLNELAKANNISDCSKDQKTKDAILSHIVEGERLGVQSTPTLVLNGVRIDGVIPLNQLYAIFDEIVSRATK